MPQPTPDSALQRGLYLWLLLAGLAHVLLGAGLAVLGAPASLDGYFALLHASTGEAAPGPAQQALVRTLIQLFGPTVASWGLLFCLLLRQYRRHGDRLLKAGLLLALLLWWSADCWISLRAGLYAHLYLNSAVLLAIAVPLLLLRPAVHAAALTQETP